MLPQQYCLRWKYHHSNLQTMFSQLLDRGCFCDVTLACEGHLIRAHRVVLCACSSFFDNILTNYASERDPILIMKDAKFADVKCLIEFMYKGEINVEHANLASLLKTAEELKIKGLAEVSWREDEVEPAVPDSEQPRRNDSASMPQRQIHNNNNNSTNNNHNNDDDVDDQQHHRLLRMPLLTPIPSPNHQENSHAGQKRKRGRPPLDDSYDVYNAPKLSFVGTANQSQSKYNNNSPGRISNNSTLNDSVNVIKERTSSAPNEWNEGMECNVDSDSEKEEKPLIKNLKPSSHTNKEYISKNTDTCDDNNGNDEDNDDDDDDDDADADEEENDNERNIIKNDEHSGHEENDAGEGTSMSNEDSDMVDEQESSTNIALTSQELEEWKDVVKMDTYLAKGRRPQFWEEPFTKRVMEAIRQKKLEMKKAAQILGVSYGTLYGRYRETYGCLKHPYSGSTFFRGPSMMSRYLDIWPENRQNNSEVNLSLL